MTRRGIPAAGTSFVIYETDKKEVTSLLADPSGNLYAASIGEKERVQGTRPRELGCQRAQRSNPPRRPSGGQPLIVLQGQSSTTQPASFYLLLPVA